MSEKPCSQPDLKQSELQACHNNLENFKVALEAEPNRKQAHIVERGDNLNRILLSLNFKPGDRPTIVVNETQEDGTVETFHTTYNYHHLEIGDQVIPSIGQSKVYIERSFIEKYEENVKPEDTLYHITRNTFGVKGNRLNLSETPLILISYNEHEEISKTQDFPNAEAIAKELLKPGNLLTLKRVNGQWQYLLHQFKAPSTIEPSMVQETSNTEVETPTPQKSISKAIETGDTYNTRREKTLAYAEQLLSGVGSEKVKSYLAELRLNLDSLTEEGDIKSFDQKCTKLRKTMAADLMTKLDGKEFERLYRSVGSSNQKLKSALINIMGTKPGLIRPGDSTPYLQTIYTAAEKHKDVTSEMLQAIFQVESMFDSMAVSDSGAVGFGQHLHFVWKGTGHERRLEHKESINPFDSKQNIYRSAAHIQKLYDYFRPKISDNMNLDHVVASAYNAGHETVRRGLNTNTRDYIAYIKKVKVGDPKYAKKVLAHVHKQNPASLVARVN